MKLIGSLVVSLGVVLGMAAEGRCAPEPAYKAGVASRVITPKESLWMAGYAGRKKPAEGKLHDLFVKAVALEDSNGKKVVILTSDLLGLPGVLSKAVAAEISAKTGLKRDQIMLTASHTHSGPVVAGMLVDMYEMPAEQHKAIETYTKVLKGTIVETILAALADVKPAQLKTGKGKADFVMNRRQKTDKGVILGVNPKGPVDPEVPVLTIESPDGEVRAIVFGYACHNTTLDGLKWCGDYAGYAEAYLEEAHPGAAALFWSGCGADANPHPRGKVELADQHGRKLADAVEAVLKQDLKTLTGEFESSYEEISLPLDDLGTKEAVAKRIDADLTSKTYAARNRALRMKQVLDAGKDLPDHYEAYPVQAWRVGNDLLWFALGGEVVVEYALHLKEDFQGKKDGAQTVWVTGYANDVMAYIVTPAMLREGGYEPDYSMIYYGFPAKWSPRIEKLILEKARSLATARK